MRRLLLGMIVFFTVSVTIGQMNYIGLANESNVRTAQLQLASTGAYWPKTQIMDGYMYVPTINGIYRKDLNLLSDTLWYLYAFPGIPIRDFVKNNDSILAVTAMIHDSLLLLSIDDGLTYINYTSPYFFNYEPVNTIWRICKNPLNPGTLIALHAGYGVSKSEDFGNTWADLNVWAGGYQEWFVGFNPNDTTNIFYSGETMVFDSYIQGSYDNGQTWSIVHSMPNHCVHLLSFHSTNPDIIISGAEGFIRKSVDRGLTWNIVASTDLYITTIISDEIDSNIIYASGDFMGYNDTLKIYRSTNGGNNWGLYYSQVITNSDGILDIHFYQNKLFIYTLINGVYMFDPALLSSEDFVNSKNQVTVFPNPFSLQTTLQTNNLLQNATLKVENYLGQTVKEIKNISGQTVILQRDNLPSGLYFVRLTEDHKIIAKRKIVITN